MESDYLQRLSSFVKWPICDEISVTALARLGFIYKEDICTLVCAYCNIQLNPNNCLLVEDILREHQQLSPRCNLVSPNTEEVIKQSATLSRFNDTTVDYSRIDKINYGFRLDQTSPATTSTDPVNRSQFSFDELCIEAVRLSTFRDWPLKAKIRPQVLARDGFFYEGSGDKVQCAFCNGCIGNWEALDEPSERHKRLFPDCHFVRGFNVGNISLVGDTSPSGGFNWNPFPAPRSPLETVKFPPTTLPQIAQNLDAPKYSEYADFERRVESFRNTIIIHGQTPEALAEAGFFYIGPLDRTRCFHCGGVLRDWEPDDNPIHEHRRWFERCAFVQSLPIETKQHKNVEPREVKARLDSPIVRIVLDMGYSVDLVKQVIENQLLTAGDDFRSAEGLLEAIFAQEKEIAVKSPDIQSVEGEPQSSCSVSMPGTEEGNVDVTTELKSETPIVMLSEFDNEQPTGADESLQFLEENRRLREARICKVCMDAEVNTVLLPCGHLVCCTACSALIDTCPICRVLIKGTVKTFLS